MVYNVYVYSVKALILTSHKKVRGWFFISKKKNRFSKICNFSENPRDEIYLKSIWRV